MATDVDRRFDRRTRVMAALKRARNKGLEPKMREVQAKAKPRSALGRARVKARGP